MLTILKRTWQALTMTANGENITEARQQPQHKSSVKLDVIVVGAGISGLATAISTALSGHSVTVFESAKELLEVRLVLAL